MCISSDLRGAALLSDCLFPTHLCAFRQTKHHWTVAVVWVVILSYSICGLLTEIGQRSWVWKPVIVINRFRWSLAKILVDFFFPFPKLKENKNYQYIFRGGWQIFMLCCWRSGGVNTSLQLLHAPVSCHACSWRLYEIQPVPGHVLHDSGSSSCLQLLDISGSCDFSLFLHMCRTIMCKCL